MTDSSTIAKLFGRVVVFDLSSMFVILGTLVEADELHFSLRDADVHDLRDSPTNRENYVRDAKLYGISANRKRVLVRRDEVVSFSAIDDVLT
ncbi:hypothetical protein [Stratiformator vulcanicus]|uniref:Uncharacterized protein n=1 Tax=Stratiformator vulcanicus TaxID=2527980 RepID=A0A517QXC9_9PLAN|nr:hypothetical protein [Stratiformator vulcanicus]QDT36291.1 hypothetical protein Pan189_06470 [Stratiformator vulcanicus]